MTLVENKEGKEIKAKAIFYNHEAYLCHRLQSSEEKRNNRWLRIAAGGSVPFSSFFFLSLLDGVCSPIVFENDTHST